MNKKDWKNIKRTGGMKRKLKYEYLNLVSRVNDRPNMTSGPNNVPANEVPHTMVLCEPSASQDPLLARGSVSGCEETGENENFVADWHPEDDSSTDDEEVCTEHMKNLIFREAIREWAVEKNITQSALKDLTKILNNRFPDILPHDPRTILKTPREVQIKVVEPGAYWHNGIIEPLKKILEYEIVEQVALNINMDGLPIFNSSNKEFWPILCNIHEINKPPFVIGVYYGQQKPNDLNSYLEDFINEINLLLKEGLTFGGKNIKVAIRCFICDSPARAYIKGVQNFNGKHGCLKCVTVGTYSYQTNTTVFPNSRCPARKDDEFRNKLYGLHHKRDSPLLQLPIDIVQDVPVADSLHLLDLGVMKRLLLGWRDGNFVKKITKWCSRDTEMVTAFLSETRLPSEIHRSMRGLKHLSHWKASEFRTFFFYLSIIILPQVLNAGAYSHFLFLYCGITICSNVMYEHLLPLAEELLLYFVEHYKDYYGADHIFSNVHNLVHVVDEVRRFGVLHTFSAYPFENKLYLIKRMLREGKNPLAQVARRLREVEGIQTTRNVAEKTHTVTIKNMKNYVEIHFQEFKLSTKNKDKYFMSKNNDIIELRELDNQNNKITLHGCKVMGLTNVFEKPVKSSHFHIYKSNTNQQTEHFICLTPQDVKLKFVCNEYNNELFFVPLLHTLVVD